MSDKPETYSCANCGGVFEKTRSDEEAMAETVEQFGPVLEKECVLFCDDCFEEFSAWLERKQRSN